MRKLIATMALAGAMTAAMMSAARAEKDIVFAHVFAANSLEQETAEVFAKKVAEFSKGELKVTVFPASQLGGWNQIATQQRSGAVHVTIISTSALGSFSPLATVDVWPFIFETREQFDKAYASEDGKAFFKAIEAESGYRVLAPTYKGFRNVYLRHDADDLKGQKIRVPGLPIVLRSFEAWGASPTPMDMAEIYTAMQQGVVDGIEIEAQTALSSGMGDVTKTVLMTKHMMPNYAFIFYGAWLDELPEAERVALEQASAEASKYFADKIAIAEAQALEAFKPKGANIKEVDLNAMKSQVSGLDKEFPDQYGWVKRLQAAAGMN
ncbi:TRAP transporter substrate-binding protein [Aerobium aerolatum]|uniref:Tripartite ATP-independent transporter solute receptor, DctP family n=1 Tax=Aquamicrobium aerolatum DSM 21857 TaxID=1121003 RepID=A0A1I3SKJ7_9HYPH|nr:TRAP transporter substrate-binding protein [Aquamicrobium aerolatum]SFJ58682.1 tripartite ATP-independent transporter solute receptor, DctP family [Aquamicrobium aerolatum DSM 21857]